jgi:hypothetical protein
MPIIADWCTSGTSNYEDKWGMKILRETFCNPNKGAYVHWGPKNETQLVLRRVGRSQSNQISEHVMFMFLSKITSLPVISFSRKYNATGLSVLLIPESKILYSIVCSYISLLEDWFFQKLHFRKLQNILD